MMLENMDTNMVIAIVTTIGFGLFGGATFAYRKYFQGSTEKFTWEKFLPTMGMGAIAAIILYFTSGAIPGFEEIFMQIDMLMPAGSVGISVVISGLLAAYNAYSKSKLAAAETVVASAPAVQAATVEQAKTTLVTAGSPASTGTGGAASQSVIVEPYEVKASGQVEVGQFKVFVPYADVGLDPSKYTVGSLDWQHACTNVIDAEAGYSALASATGKPCPANPLEVASLKAAAALATYQGITGKSIGNIKEDLAVHGIITAAKE